MIIIKVIIMKSRMMNKYLSVIFLLCILFLTEGCRSADTSYHIRQDVDFSTIKRVAVVPFENLSSEKSADEIVKNIVINELLVSGLVDVVVPGDVTAALSKLDIKSGSSLSAEQIKALGRELKVQAVFLGSVLKYGETRDGNISAPEVSITFIMAEIYAGNVIWSVTKTRGGAGFMARHFGARSETLTETALSVVREAIQTLTKF
jgi:TolB-like protein